MSTESLQEKIFNHLMNSSKFINGMRNGLDALGEDEEGDFKRFIFQDGGIIYLAKIMQINNFEKIFGQSYDSHRDSISIVLDFVNDWKIYRENGYKKTEKNLNYSNYKGNYSAIFWEEVSEKIKKI